MVIKVSTEEMKHQVKHKGADPIEDKRQQSIARAKEKAGRVLVKELFDRWASTDLINRKDHGNALELYDHEKRLHLLEEKDK